ncbi:hypothetical protein FB451DRAFT_1292634 [Mycena latifolia]|nr:hypothetical protein FB451DRAFT_1292634 [Mycena latifolia]
MDPHHSHPRSSSARSPAEFASDSPHIFTPPWLKRRQAPPTDASPANSTPPWFKRRENPPTQASPSPPLPSLPQACYSMPQLEVISVPEQAQYLTVVPPPENPVLRDHVPRPRGSARKARPQDIKVLPASRPIALVTAHTPLNVPPPISAVYRPPSHGQKSGSGRGGEWTPGSPEPSPYVDPGLATGIPRALGLRAFPVRAQKPWRHGG